MLFEIKEPGQHKETQHQEEIAVGIDLGTTNSVVATSEQGNCKTFADNGRDIIPSVVSYGVDEIHVGYDAIEKDNAIYSVKRLMGRNSEDEIPVKVSAQILSKLKSISEDSLNKTVNKAVITVPAYFDNAARKATKDAAKIAGLEVLRLINEPTAAALAYGLDNDAEGIYAVYDLGGGTFDISILQMQKGVFKVLSTAGDTELGGDDFDVEISKKLGCGIKKAREIKEKLTQGSEAEGLTREEFEQLIEPFIAKTINTCHLAVSDASVDLEKINGIVLVGGSTRIPLVRKKITEYFGDEPLSDIDPDRVVAYGAAIQAEHLTRGSGTLLLDVTPLSLGLETYGGLVEKIIERNSAIPVSQFQEFTTYKDGQSAMKIHVLQGEREMVDQCRSLAHFDLQGIPPMAAGLARIKVTFNLDADGLLTVSAREETTKVEQKVEVKPSYGLSPERTEEMLRESFSHAKKDIIERLLIESRLEANQLLRTIENAIAEDNDLLDGKQAEAINTSITELKEAIRGVDRELIDFKAQALDKICGTFAEKRVNRALTNALKGKNVDNIDLEVANNG